MSQFKPGDKAYLLDFEQSAIEAVTVKTVPNFGVGFAMVYTSAGNEIDASPLNLFRSMEAARIALTNRKRLAR